MRKELHLFGLDDAAVVTGIFKGLLAIIVALIAWSGATYATRHPEIKIQGGITIDDATFKAADKEVTFVTASDVAKLAFSAKGDVYWSGYQSKGKDDTKYRVDYKLTSDASYTKGVSNICKYQKLSSAKKLVMSRKRSIIILLL